VRLGAPPLKGTVNIFGQASSRLFKCGPLRFASGSARGVVAMAELVAYFVIVGALVLIGAARAISHHDRRSHSHGMRLF
jgi:hypothetical protein